LFVDDLGTTFGEIGRLGAVVSHLMPTEAHEVRIDGAVACFRFADHEPRTAFPAVHRGFQIVVMLLGAFPRGVVCFKDGLNLVPDLGSNEGFVCSVVAHSPVDDVAFVQTEVA